MKPKRRKRGSLSKMADAYREEIRKTEVIRVEAVPIGKADSFLPIPQEEEPSSFCLGNVLGFLMGGKENFPSSMTCASESSEDGEADKRLFNYQEEGGRWTFDIRWSASGTGPLPMSIKLLGSMKELFNDLGDMMLGRSGICGGAPVQGRLPYREG